MSGPISTQDATPAPLVDAPELCEVEVIDGRYAEVGAFHVRRVLPRRPRRTVGSWCFVDHMGPGSVSAAQGLDIGPHPHIGLQTVTWLVQGEILHRDSLGSEQLIRPGQLNLMTAGHGVSHSEETRGVYSGPLHGVQFWVAQPEETRHGAPGFEHHAELPQVDLANAVATVLVGQLGDAASPARRDTDHLGLDIRLRPGVTTLPLNAEHEHAVVLIDGEAAVHGCPARPGQLAYLGTGRDEVAIEASAEARLMVIGGKPFPDPLMMWWNYVGRTREEVAEAHEHWVSGHERFGTVSSPLERIVVGHPPWVA